VFFFIAVDENDVTTAGIIADMELELRLEMLLMIVLVVLLLLVVVVGGRVVLVGGCNDRNCVCIGMDGGGLLILKAAGVDRVAGDDIDVVVVLLLKE